MKNINWRVVSLFALFALFVIGLWFHNLLWIIGGLIVFFLLYSDQADEWVAKRDKKEQATKDLVKKLMGKSKK